MQIELPNNSIGTMEEKLEDSLDGLFQYMRQIYSNPQDYKRKYENFKTTAYKSDLLQRLLFCGRANTKYVAHEIKRRDGIINQRAYDEAVKGIKYEINGF